MAARAFVRKLGFRSKVRGKWKAYCKSGKKPDDIPVAPWLVYSADWISEPDWFGTKPLRPIDGYRPFMQARAFVRKLGLRGRDEWAAYCQSEKKPADIPYDPRAVYRADWISMGDWFGNGQRRGGWRPFKEARAFVRSLRFASTTEWLAYCKSGKKPDDIPTTPERVYADSGWVNWPDWLKRSGR